MSKKQPLLQLSPSSPAAAVAPVTCNIINVLPVAIGLGTAAVSGIWQNAQGWAVTPFSHVNLECAMSLPEAVFRPWEGRVTEGH